MITIVLATYNGDKYISKQIDSIINQSYRDWQLFIHDDGSFDSTVQIIKEYELNDDRIKLLEDGELFHNSSGNFIHLLKKVPESTDYICLCDQDDIWKYNKLEIELSVMHEKERMFNGPICLSSDMSLINSKGEELISSFWNDAGIDKHSTFSSLFITNTATGGTMMMNKRVLAYIKGLSKNDITSIIQHDWYIALICASDGCYFQIDKTLNEYRQHNSNVVGAQKFSISDKIMNHSVLKSIKKIQQLKLRVCKQLILVRNSIKSEANKKIISNYVNSHCINHKFQIIRNNINKSISKKQELVKLLLY